LIGHEKYGTSGRRALGILPYFFKLMFLARFEKQLQGPKVPMPDRKNTMVILRDLLASGKLTPIVDSTYPLRQAGDALRHMIEHETCGKVIITMTGAD
jgi:NADPH:quinone reductase-like Zn-dependent oxidoreductase